MVISCLSPSRGPSSGAAHVLDIPALAMDWSSGPTRGCCDCPGGPSERQHTLYHVWIQGERWSEMHLRPCGRIPRGCHCVVTIGRSGFISVRSQRYHRANGIPVQIGNLGESTICAHCGRPILLINGVSLLLTRPTVSPLIIPLVYCHIKSFQRASNVEKPSPGGEKRGLTSRTPVSCAQAYFSDGILASKKP